MSWEAIATFALSFVTLVGLNLGARIGAGLRIYRRGELRGDVDAYLLTQGRPARFSAGPEDDIDGDPD